MDVRLSTIDIIIFAVYVLVIIALGVYASRKSGKSKRDYFLAGDKLPWWMIGGSIVAANISSHHLVGAMGLAYQRGFVAMTIEWGAILVGFNALLWVFLPYYLRNGFYTMPEYLQRRFGDVSRMAFAALILLTYLFVEISAVLYLGGIALYSLLGIPISVSIWVLAIATGLYTITGGLRAVIWTEMFQLIILMAGGIALSVATIIKIGGPGPVLEMSDQWHLILPANDPDFPWTMYLGGLLCISVFYCAANQFIVQRVLAAKNEWHARMGVVFTCYLKFLIPLIIIVPGLAAVTLFPGLEKPDLVFPTLVKNLLPSGLIGLVMAGLVAAVMSHISGAVNSCSTIAAIDFYIPIRNRLKERRNPVEKVETSEDEDRKTVRFGRIFGVITILFGIFWGQVLIQHSEKPVFLYIFNAYGYFTPGIATMFLMGIFWKRTTNAGALTAGILTIPLSVIMDFALPWMPFFNRTGIVFWICMVTCVLVSLVTRPKPAEELEGLIWTPASLRMPEGQGKLRWYARPVVWWGLITVIVLAFYVTFP